jgi:hypothetical protein
MEKGKGANYLGYAMELYEELTFNDIDLDVNTAAAAVC